MKPLIISALLAATSLCQTGAAGADEIKTSGTGTYVTVAAETAEAAGGGTLMMVRQKGIVRDDDPSSPLHLSAQDCTGHVSVSADGATVTGGGSCVATDRDGDMWWLWWTTTGMAGEWGVTAGTGKYAGATGGGTIANDVSYPDRDSLTYSGTITLN